MKQRPEKPTYPICAAINAEWMGGLIRFLNHSCEPAAEFREVSNGRRTTVVAATTRRIWRGEEVTVDYGDDLWFVCRCQRDGCRHRNIQAEEDPCGGCSVARSPRSSADRDLAELLPLGFSHFRFCQTASTPSLQVAHPLRHKLHLRSLHALMVRQTGNPNYTSADVDRLLLLIENELPLGRDEWERLATTYNANRPRGAPERDFESLRRKFKVLYSTWKPTAMPNMPPLVKKAKEVTQAIDDKANVIEMNEAADEDRPIEPVDAARTLLLQRPLPRVVRSRAGCRRHVERLQEAEKYPKLHSFSKRLGGQDLATFRDTVGVKRALEEDKETMEASFAKAKRIRALRTSTALKTKLASREAAANNTGEAFARRFSFSVRRTNARPKNAAPKRKSVAAPKSLLKRLATLPTKQKPWNAVA
ncbi:hypothetical protein PR003_g1434 [Phytophthora rubi]|uniref:SET domain-containing protein n=1 Tax=Phytophthora rubi TaxID=129364 RepID=A0A6A4G2E4_9STRA|nr:hypothetical protein PR001_g9762 [Phytophthora rubi]KAE9358188.1 hypothetical protein PR003_g1434 [Phytophthora rubi]